jgi:hypothetical protein
VEVMGYKKIMNLPDYSKSGYRTIKLQTQEGSSGKFQPAAGFFTGTAGQTQAF